MTLLAVSAFISQALMLVEALTGNLIAVILRPLGSHYPPMSCLLVCLMFLILFQDRMSGLWVMKESSRPPSLRLSPLNNRGGRLIHFECCHLSTTKQSHAGGKRTNEAESSPLQCAEGGSGETSNTG